MTELLEQAIEHVRALPSEQQDELGRVLLRLANAEQGPVSLSAAKRGAIAGSKAATARDEFATYKEVRAVRTSYNM